MLRRFEVKNFKCFNDNFVLDLTDVKNYEFNPECVQDGIVKKALIYGPNACGKSNLGLAIFDIKTHLTDKKIDERYQQNYLNAASDAALAEFVYTFQFAEHVVTYRYGKKAVDELVYEQVEINGEEVISLDRRISNIADIKLAGAETLRRELDKESNISIVNYVLRNSDLEENDYNSTLKKLHLFPKFMIRHSVNGGTRNSRAFSNFFEQRNNSLNSEHVKDLQQFLNKHGVNCSLSTIQSDGEDVLAFDFGEKKLDLIKNASSGTISLCDLYLLSSLLLKDVNAICEELNLTPFFLIDEFDAFYHHQTALTVMTLLKEQQGQVIATTHNTSIMTNDLLRPDCYFIMDSHSAKPLHSFTDKELRKAHNIEKMYKAGAFS